MTKNIWPWDEIQKPSTKNAVNKRRVDQKLNRDIWWTKNDNGQVGLQIQFDVKINKAVRVETFDACQASFDNNFSHFMLKHFMISSENIEVFYSLALDIIKCIEEFKLKSNEEIIELLFSRVKKWQSLFARSKQEFDENQQLGLLGELTFMNDTLLKTFDYKKVLHIWRGPIPEPQDFVSSKWGVEVKAQWATSEPVVSINSLNQLDVLNGDIVISHRKFKPYVGTDTSYISLRNQIDAILEEIDGDNFYTQILFGLLRNIGCDYSASYCDKEYSLHQKKYYLVAGSFPCLMRSKISNAIVSANYKLDLNALIDFEIDNGDLERILIS